MSVANVVFRASGGARVGLGHIRRCLSLADALRDLDAVSWFVVCGDDAALKEVRSAGYACAPLQPDNDFERTLHETEIRDAASLVLDAYELDRLYFERLSGRRLLIAVLDDFGQTELAVDVLINAAAGAEELEYPPTPGRRYLLGPRFALLRREFEQKGERAISADVRRILVTLGGADPHSLTAAVACWITEAFPAADVDVVVGPFARTTREMEEVVRRGSGRVHLHHAPPSMRTLMLSADLAISGGGQTTYELAASGTPTVALIVAQNQVRSLEQLADEGVLAVAGDARDPDLKEKMLAALDKLASSVRARQVMSRRGRELVDGRGAARVAETILELAKERS